MDSIRIETGEKRIAINDDPSRVISFNPNDVQFAEKFYALLRDFNTKQAEYSRRAEALDEGAKELDGNGIPLNAGESIAFLRDVCEYVRSQIDTVFGAGTSQTVFGDTLSIDAFGQFFTGITPFFQSARAEKLLKYANEKNAGRVMR